MRKIYEISVVVALVIIASFATAMVIQNAMATPVESYDYEVNAVDHKVFLSSDISKNTEFTVKFSDGFSSQTSYSLVGDVSCKQGTNATDLVSSTLDMPGAEANYVVLHVTVGELSKNYYSVTFNLKDSADANDSGTEYVFAFGAEGYICSSVDMATSHSLYITTESAPYVNGSGNHTLYVVVDGITEELPTSFTSINLKKGTTTVGKVEKGFFDDARVLKVSLAKKQINNIVDIPFSINITTASGMKYVFNLIVVNQIPNTEPELFTGGYTVSGSSNAPNVFICNAVSSNPTIIYSNSSLLDGAITAKVLNNGVETQLGSVKTASFVNGYSTIMIEYTGQTSFKSVSGAVSPAEIQVSIGGNVAFSIFMVSGDYWDVVDISSNELQKKRLYYAEDALAATNYVDLVQVRGLTSIDNISYNIPGVTITDVSDSSHHNGGFSVLNVLVDWESVVKGEYDVTITSGGNQFTFKMEVNKCTSVTTATYDYEFIGVTNLDHAVVNWDITSKESLHIKVQIPSMTVEPTVTGSFTVGNNVTDLMSYVEYEKIGVDLENKTIEFTLTNRSLSIPSNWYKLTFSEGNQGAGGILDLNVIIPFDEIVTMENNTASAEDWNIVQSDNKRVRMNGFPESNSNKRVVPQIFKDGELQNDYSEMVSVSAVYFHEGYVLLSVDKLDGLTAGSYDFVITYSDVQYSLSFNVVESSTDVAAQYSLSCEHQIRGANVRLSIAVSKIQNGTDLAEPKLLVIAKYQGGITINFYSKPTMENGSGNDIIELTTQNLRQVIVELVDGFQDGSPVYHAVCDYTVGA